MRYATILQPGQIWASQYSDASHRTIIDVFEDRILYRHDGMTGDGPPISESRRLFRRWIKEHGARIVDQDPVAAQKISPSAELGKRIQTLRLAAGLQRQELADALGVSLSSVTYWETGREGSAQKHLAALARVLGVDEDVLLTGSMDDKIDVALSQDEHDLIMLYRMLTASRKLNAQKWMERQTNRESLSEIKKAK
jgi:transcriptional regulator with XRE-family HTH domain